MRHFKNYFIPHIGNDHKPHSLRHKSVLAIFLLVIMIELGFLVQVFVVFDKTNFLASVLPGVLTSLTNNDRINNKLSPLVENELLKKAAEAKAQDMAENGYFAHTSPDGKTPWYWLTQVGYKYVYAGENLAVNFFDSEDVEQAWMNSPTHRANIVKENYTEIGIGIASGKYQGRNTVFVAQFFGTPQKSIVVEKSAPVVPKPATPKPAAPVVPVAPIVPVPAPIIPIAEPTQVTVLGEEAISSTPISTSNTKTPDTNLLKRILTSPKNSVTYAYSMITLFVLLALGLYIFIKSEIKHPAMIVRGVSLIVVIGMLSFINLRVLDVKIEIPSNITANVIQALE